jgi:uncharacterized protein YdaU (DUF1376 family)
MDCEWFRWYPALYKADTMHLTAEQDGIYRRLIDHYMETRQPLPDSDAAIARIAGVSLDAWAMAAAIVRPFFTPDGKGGLRQKRCDVELDRQDASARTQSEKGKAGAAKRWGNQKANSNGHAPAIAGPMPNDSRGEERRGEEIVGGQVVTSLKAPCQENRFPEFWSLFPKQRAGNKEKAEQAYRKATSRASEEAIIQGVRDYIGSDEVARGFAKGAASWLNDDRWTVDYKRTPIRISKPTERKPTLRQI